MGYAVVHMQKMKSGAVGGIQSHNNREHEPRTNPDVDMSRSYLNYDIVPCHNYQKAIKEKREKLVVSKKAVRKDAVILCNFIITSDEATMKEMGADRQRAFFNEAVKWFADRYGADRIVNATVHMDETTPHLHLGLMPITKDGRLSAKSIFDKSELKQIQTEFAKDVGQPYGLERGVEGSDRTHLSETKFKLAHAEECLDEYEYQIACADAKFVDKRFELGELEDERKRKQEEIAKNQERLEKSEKELQDLEEKKEKARSELQDNLGKNIIMLRELPVLETQISERKQELEVVGNAVKSLKDNATKQFSMDSMQRAIHDEKEKSATIFALKKRIVELENKVRMFDKFMEFFPSIRKAWERFCQIIRSKNEPKKESHRRNELER